MANLSGPFIRTGVGLRLPTGVKERNHPPPQSPLSPLSFPLRLTPQQVPLFCSRRRLLQDESLAELNRPTCVTRGYRAIPLIFHLTDDPFLFLCSALLRLVVWLQLLKSAAESLWGQCMAQRVSTYVDVAICVTHGREQPAVWGGVGGCWERKRGRRR